MSFSQSEVQIKIDSKSSNSIPQSNQQVPPTTLPTISELLERNRRMRSEIKILSELVHEKHAEFLDLQTSSSDVIVKRHITNLPEPVYLHKLKGVIRVIGELENFVNEDGLNNDVIDEYIRHIESTYTKVLIFRSEEVQLIRNASPEQCRQLLDAKRAFDYEKVIFVLKENGRYSLILFNSKNASFYHYDTAKGNSEMAEHLIFRLRRYFVVQQLVEVESKFNFVNSSLSTVDYMMKIVLNAEESNGGDVSPVQLLNRPSHPDHLKIIIMSRYIVMKLALLERLIEEDENEGQ